MSAMLTSELRAAPKIRSGKVRDVYDVGEALLIVATDRISAFDVIMPSPVPDKGRILHQMTLFWLEQLAGVCPNHLITAELDEFPEVVRKDPSAESLRGRSMLVKKAEVFPIECVARVSSSNCGPAIFKHSRAASIPAFLNASSEESTS